MKIMKKVSILELLKKKDKFRTTCAYFHLIPLVQLYFEQ